jgi:general secretion pathway protein F
MPYFRYKAVSAAGEVIEGEIEAADRRFLVNRLHADGYTPVRADEVVAGRIGGGLKRQVGGRRLSVGDLALVSHEMATLVKAGLSIDRALTSLVSLADKPAKRVFLGRLLEKVRSGVSLSAAMELQKDILPSYYAGMVRAGEASNNLAPVFFRLADLLGRAKAVKESVRSALLYPIVVLVVAAFTISVLLAVVVPQFRPLIESAGGTLPLPTLIIVSLGDIVREYWWACIALPVLAVLALRHHYHQQSGRRFWDERLLKLPILGSLIRDLETARFTRTLGILLESGVTELHALSIAVSTVSNQAMASALSEVGARLRRGDGWAAPLHDSKVISERAIQFIHVGEESGQLEDMLNQAAQVLDDDAQRTLQRLLDLLVPAITILLGLIVAAIIGAMLLAILSTYSIPL